MDYTHTHTYTHSYNNNFQQSCRIQNQHTQISVCGPRQCPAAVSRLTAEPQLCPGGGRPQKLPGDATERHAALPYLPCLSRQGAGQPVGCSISLFKVQIDQGANKGQCWLRCKNKSALNLYEPARCRPMKADTLEKPMKHLVPTATSPSHHLPLHLQNLHHHPEGLGPAVHRIQ